MSVLPQMVDVSDFVSVALNISPTAVPYQNFGLPLIIGDSNVIDVGSRIRSYANIGAVASDFSLSSPEYAAAALYFSQIPQPNQLMIGRWASTAPAGLVNGAILTATQQILGLFTAVTAGAMLININGVPYAISGVSFASAQSLNAVAALLQTALNAVVAGTTCVWNSILQRFTITSGTTGVTSAVSVAAAPTAIGNAVFSANPVANDQIVINGTGVTFVSSITQANQVIIGSSLSGFATGTVTLSGNLAVNDQIVINGVSTLIVASNALGPQVNIGTTQALTLANLLTFLQAQTTGGLAACTYASNGTNILYITAATSGTAGNSITLNKVNGTNATLSGTTLTGGGVSTMANLLTLLNTLTATVGCTFTESVPVYGSATLYVNAGTPGASGNSITLAKVNGTNITLSGATLAGGSGTDISTLMGLTLASGAVAVGGIAAEAPVAAVVAATNVSTQWYGVTFASTSSLAISDHIAIAANIAAQSRARIYGISIFGGNVGGTAALDPTQTADLASQIAALRNRRVFMMYSSLTNWAAMTIFGRAFTVNFNGNNTTITLAYKQAPGVAAEYLTETQKQTLQAKGCNVNLAVNNGAVMIWPGQMSDVPILVTNGTWFDEVHGLDWLTNRIQTDVFNLMYQTTTKIPQTDAGNNLIVMTIQGSCVAAVNNGLAAPGVWNASGFGALQQGMVLTTGYYIYAPLIATQSQSDREARKSVPFQIAVKLAGAIHVVFTILNINR